MNTPEREEHLDAKWWRWEAAGSFSSHRWLFRNHCVPLAQSLFMPIRAAPTEGMKAKVKVLKMAGRC